MVVAQINEVVELVLGAAEISPTLVELASPHETGLGGRVVGVELADGLLILVGVPVAFVVPRGLSYFFRFTVVLV